MEERIYKGDMVNNYFVVQAVPGHFHLIHKQDMNRWSDETVEARYSNGEMFITREDIEKTYPSFEGFNLTRKKDYSLVKISDSTLSKLKVNVDVTSKVIKEVNAKDLEPIISHSLVKTESRQLLIHKVQTIAADITKFINGGKNE